MDLIRKFCSSLHFKLTITREVLWPRKINEHDHTLFNAGVLSRDTFHDNNAGYRHFSP